jgi:hypothetical protein
MIPPTQAPANLRPPGFVPDERIQNRVCVSESHTLSANSLRICILLGAFFVTTPEVVQLRFSNGIAGDV